jgi:hypothetical protein
MVLACSLFFVLYLRAIDPSREFPPAREPENRGNAMDEVQSLQFFMLFMCAIAAVLVAGTGMVIYLLYRVERTSHVPRVHRPAHGLRVLLNRR